tara:strand:+ start:142 stop:813 length:672 start_codon:yes stop_codon:yes gene_type:complete
MHQRKSKKILIYFFLLIIVSSIGNNSINNLNLSKIQNINISGLDPNDNQILLNNIKNLNAENIFSINKNEIVKLINSNSLVETYEVFKKYPSTININIQKTSFFARINDNGKIFLIGSNGELTLANKTFNELPYIFGKPNIDEFLKFKKIIDKSKFSYNKIENFYFFPSKRWDLKLKDNILIKLPNNFSYETLDHLYKFLKINNIKSFTVLDARINNQIIINE